MKGSPPRNCGAWHGYPCMPPNIKIVLSSFDSAPRSPVVLSRVAKNVIITIILFNRYAHSAVPLRRRSAKTYRGSKSRVTLRVVREWRDCKKFPRFPEAPGRRLIRVFTCRRGIGHRILRVFTCRRRPRSPRRAYHMCFYVSEKPRKPNYTCFHVPEKPRGLGRSLVGSGRAAGGPQEAPRGPRRGQEVDLYVFLRVI